VAHDVDSDAGAGHRRSRSRNRHPAPDRSTASCGNRRCHPSASRLQNSRFRSYAELDCVSQILRVAGLSHRPGASSQRR
jgi:hypothetical protein